MRVLVACEFSGIVRDAFIRRGHDAVSCDLLPSERPGPHIQGDVTPLLQDEWDMVIAHPPCAYLSYVGTAHWGKPGRAEKRAEALGFFKACYDANAPQVCVENPFGWPCQAFKKPSQVINPFDFGEPVRKRTCLWLRGLPLLFRGDDLFGGNSQPVPAPEPVYVQVRTEKSREAGKLKRRHTQDIRPRHWHFIESVAPGMDRAHKRSRTFRSIAEAMAEQWG